VAGHQDHEGHHEEEKLFHIVWLNFDGAKVNKKIERKGLHRRFLQKKFAGCKNCCIFATLNLKMMDYESTYQRSWMEETPAPTIHYSMFLDEPSGKAERTFHFVRSGSAAVGTVSERGDDGGRCRVGGVGAYL
jgi:hypothetical protein